MFDQTIIYNEFQIPILNSYITYIILIFLYSYTICFYYFIIIMKMLNINYISNVFKGA